MIPLRNILEVGVIADGITPCADAFQQALNSGHTHWHLPAGTYLIDRTLRLPSHTTLMADKNAVICLADGAARTENDYLLTNSEPANSNMNIHIEGGTWDGNNIGNPRPKGDLMATGYTGAMIHFSNVSGLTLKNMKQINAEAYYTRIALTRNFHIENISFDSNHIRHNNDGIHLGGHCYDGVIKNIKGLRPGVTGDDLVALNGDDACNRNEVRGMLNGPIERVHIENLQADGCHSFVRLLCVFSHIRDVTVRKVRGSCKNHVINADGARGCRVMVFDAANPPYDDGVGMLENILIEDLEVHGVGENHSALFNMQQRMKNVFIKNARRNREKDRTIDGPTVRIANIAIDTMALNGEALPSLSTLAPNLPFDWHGDHITSLSFNTASRSSVKKR